MPNQLDRNDPQFGATLQIPQMFGGGAQMSGGGGGNTMQLPQQFQPHSSQMMILPQLFQAYALGHTHGYMAAGRSSAPAQTSSKPPKPRPRREEQ